MSQTDSPLQARLRERTEEARFYTKAFGEVAAVAKFLPISYVASFALFFHTVADLHKKEAIPLTPLGKEAMAAVVALLGIGLIASVISYSAILLARLNWLVPDGDYRGMTGFLNDDGVALLTQLGGWGLAIATIAWPMIVIPISIVIWTMLFS